MILGKIFIQILILFGKWVNLLLLLIYFIFFKILIIFEKFNLIKLTWKKFNKFLITYSKIIKIYNFIINCLIFIYLFLIILFFSIFIYLLIIYIASFFNFFPGMFSCNRMLLFFFIYLFVFLLFCKDDFFDNFFEFNFIDFRKDLSERAGDWYFSYNEALDFFDQEVDDYMIEYEWEYEEILYDVPPQGISVLEAESTGSYHLSSTDRFLEKNSEFLDNLYFFERWLNLSYEILDRIEFQRKITFINNKKIQQKLNKFLTPEQFYSYILNDYLNIFNYFSINNTFFFKTKNNFLKINNLNQLSKIFLYTNDILHDDISFIINYFKIAHIVTDSKERKKYNLIKFYGHSDFSKLSIIKYKKFFNYNIFSEFENENLIKNKSLKKNYFNNLLSKDFFYGFNSFFFSGLIKNFSLNESKLVKIKYISNCNDNLFKLYVNNSKLKYLLINNYINYFDFNFFYINYLRYLLIKFPDKILLTEEEREYLILNYSFNSYKNNKWIINYPSEFVNEFLSIIIERHFRIVLKAYFTSGTNFLKKNFDTNLKNFLTNLLKNFLNIFFKKFISLKFFNNFYIKYKYILYKILAKGWKNTKITQKQFYLLSIINKLFINNNFLTNFYVPYNNLSINVNEKKKNFKNIFDFTFLSLKILKKRILKRIILKKNFSDKYNFKFFYRDSLATQFFYNNFKKNKIKNSIYFNFKLIYSIKDLKYFIFIFIPKLFNFNQLNLKYIVSNRLYLRLYKYLFNILDKKINLNNLPNDFFFFPFFNFILRKQNDKNLYLEKLQYRLDSVFQSEFVTSQIILAKPLLKLINSLNNTKFNIDFFFILDILKIYFFSNFKNYKSFFSYIYSYNCYVYKKLFIFKLLKQKKYKIKNLNNFKYTLSLYFYKFFSYNHFKTNFIFKTSEELNIFDYEILNSLLNKYWAIGFSGPLTYYHKYNRKLANSRGFTVIDFSSPEPVNDSLSVYKDFYPTNWMYFNSILNFLDMWFSKKFIDYEDNTDEEDYTIFWIFLFFFWFFCRWLRFYNRSNLATARIERLTKHETYSDSYKLWYLELISSGSNVFLGTNYVGNLRGPKVSTLPWKMVKEAYMLPMSIYGPFIYNTNSGKKLKKHMFSEDKIFHENHFNKSYHSLIEYKYELDDAAFVINDYFRFSQNRVNLTKQKLKWLLYGNLRNSLNLNSFKKEYIQNIFGNTFNEHYQIQRNGRRSGYKRPNRGEFIIRDPLTAHRDNIKFLNNIHYNDLYIQHLKPFLNLNYLNLKYFFIFKKKIVPQFARGGFKKIEENLEDLRKKKKLLPYWAKFWIGGLDYSIAAHTHNDETIKIEERYYDFTEMQMAMQDKYEVKNKKYHRDLLRKVNLPLLEKTFLEYEAVADLYLRPTRRYVHFLYQGFLNQTTLNNNNKIKNKLSNYKYNLLIHYLTRNILGSIYKNVTQYREKIKKKYSDTIYYLPMYLKFISDLNPIYAKKFLKNNLDFYHLIYRLVSNFSEEPLLNTFFINLDRNIIDQSFWYRYLYQNPWFIKNYDKAYIRMSRSNKHRRYAAFRYWRHGVDYQIRDKSLTEVKDLIKPVGFLKKIPSLSVNQFWIDLLSYMGLMRNFESWNIQFPIIQDENRDESAIIQDFDDEEIGPLVSYITGISDKNIANLLLKTYERVSSPIYDNNRYEFFKAVGIFSFRKVSLYDTVGDRIKYPFESLFNRLFYTRTFGDFIYYDFVRRFVRKDSMKQNDFLYHNPFVENTLPVNLMYLYQSAHPGYTPNSFLTLTVRNQYASFTFDDLNGKKLFNYLKYYLLSPRTVSEKRFHSKTYPRQYVYHNKIYDSPLVPKFRNFRFERYNRLKGEFLFNVARQIVENLYEHSDSTFESKPNYLEGPHMFGGVELGSYEADTVRQWYQPREKIKFEHFAKAYVSVAIWPWLSRVIYRLPSGTPPLYGVDVHGVPERTRYLLKNHKLYYPERFRDPIDDDDAFENNFNFLEEGTLARFWLYPLANIVYDTFLSIFKKIFLIFDKTNFYFYLQSYNGIGDFYNRPLNFRDGFLNNSIKNTLELKRYKSKYIDLQNNTLKNSYNIVNSSIYMYLTQVNNTKLSEFILSKAYDIKYLINVLYEKVYFFKKYILWIEAWSNGLMFSNRYLIFTFILFWFLLYYICWLPILYSISVLRNWIDYPNEADKTGQTEDDSDEEEYTQQTIYPSDGLKEIPLVYGKEGLLGDSGINYGTLGQDISFDVVEYFLNFYTNYEYGYEDGIEFINFNYMDETNFNLFLDSTHTLIKNEIFYLYNISLPGNNYVYNLIDIYSLVNAEFRLSKFQAPLPQYRIHFQEFLTVLTGYKKTQFDWNQEFTLNRDEMFNYFVEEERTEFHDLRKRKVLKFDNIVESRHTFDAQNRNPNFKYTKFSSLATIENNGYALNALPTTVWYSNKIFIDGLNLINFSLTKVINTNLFNKFLVNENQKICYNMLDFNFDINSWINFSKFNFYNIQYKLGESFLPFYLRFNRANYLLRDLSYLNEPLTRNLKIFSESIFDYKKDSFDVVNTHDLFMVQPENHEGLINLDVGLNIITNLKNYFDTILIAENCDNLEEIMLDFHNLEIDKWYSREIMQVFKNHDADFFDWIRIMEETKEWVIYLEDNRFISLKPEQRFVNYEHDDVVFIDLYYMNFVKYKNPIEQLLFLYRKHKHRQNKLAYTSKQYIVPTEMHGRYYEEPLFPDRELYFSDILLEHNSKQKFYLESSLKKIIKKKPFTVFSRDTFCHAISLQLVNLEVVDDINKILTPKHRSINKRLSLESSVQLLSYTNFYLNKHRLHNYVFNYKYKNKYFYLNKKKKISIFFYFIFFYFIVIQLIYYFYVFI